MPPSARKPAKKAVPQQPETPEPAPAAPTELSREQQARLRQKLTAKYH